MPYATPYDAQYNFYTGFPWDETQEGIWWNYPGLKFTEGGGEDAYNIDPTTINQLRIPGPGDRDAFGNALFTSSLTGQYVAPEALETLLQQASYVSGIPYQSIDPAKFEQDLAMYLQRSPYGIPVEGGRYGDNAGDGYSLGSLLSNEFVLAALATGAAAGAAALTAAPAAGATVGGTTAGTASGIGAAEAGTGIGTGLGTTGAGIGTAGTGSALVPAFEGGAIGATGTTAFTTPAVASTGTGLFGTGITAGQALKGGMALGTGIASIAGGASGGGSGGSGGAGGNTTGQNPEIEANRQWARNLALRSIAPRLAQLQEGVNSLTQLSNASPMALTQRLSPQIEQARDALDQMFAQTAQRFGPYGGGQTEREQVRGAEQIGGKVGGLFGGTTNQAREAIGKLIENFQTIPQPPAQIQSTNIGNTTQPFNPASILASLQTGAALGRVGERVGSWLDSPSGQGGNYGGISQGFDTQSQPYDYWNGIY